MDQNKYKYAYSFFNRCCKLLTVECGAEDRNDREGVAHLALKEQVNSAADTVRLIVSCASSLAEPQRLENHPSRRVTLSSGYE